MTGIVHVVSLLVIWLALWGDVSVANVASGIVVSVTVVVLFGTRHRGEVVIRPLRAAMFAAYFLVELFRATLVVAVAIVSPRRDLRSGIVAVPLHGCSDALVTLIADAISLTPGTLTLEARAEPPTLFVHVLHLRSAEIVQRDVRRLEALAVRAFGTAEAVAGLDAGDPPAADGGP